MEFTQFIRRPFVVDAVEITVDNMEEIAQSVGELRVRNGIIFIALDRRIVPNIYRAYVGWWMTRLGDNYRFYPPKAFKDQFISHKPVIAFSFDDEEEDDEETEEVLEEVEAAE